MSSGLMPYSQLTLSVDKTFYGAVTYCGDSISWTLPAMVSRADVAARNLCLDPSGAYVIQTPVYLPVSADPSLWTYGPGGSGATYTKGTDEATRLPFIKQQNGTYGVGFDATFAAQTRPQDTGFVVNIYRGGPISPQTPPAQVTTAGDSDHTFYLEFCAGQLFNLRLAVEKGSPLRLDVTHDGGKTWQPVQTSQNKDSEAYLTGTRRRLNVAVFPLCDGNYYADASAGLSPTFGPYQQGVFTCDPPPSKIVVSVNDGDEVFEYKADQCSLPPGAIRVNGMGGQWCLEYRQLWFQANASISLPRQFRPRQFQTQGQGGVIGYVPPANAATLTPTLQSLSSASALLAVTGPPTPQVLPPGQAVIVTPKTVMLSTAVIDFPPAFLGPQPGIGLVQFENDSLVEWHHEHAFDQSNFLGRTSGMVEIADPNDLLSPGQGLPLGVQAFQLWAGLKDTSIDYDDGQVAMTGLVGVGRGSLTWEYRDKIKYVRLALSDRLRTHVAVGFVPVMDGQCHYYAMRQLGYRLGFTDDQMPFPYCTRDSACPHYHLPSGTTFDPLFRFAPNMTVVQAMLEVRRYSGEIDPATGTILPMYLYVDRLGVLQYFGAPVGLVNLWLNGGTPESQNLSPVKIYSAVPQFSDGLPLLNEFVRTGPMGSRAELDNIRAPIMMQGLRPTDGAFLEGFVSNDALIDDPSIPGYVGLPVPYVETSRLFTSEGAIAMSLAVAEVQYSFPSVESYFDACYQSGLYGLQFIAVQDYGTQGNVLPVPYYSTLVQSSARADGTLSKTYCEGRLLGEAGS